LATTVKEALPVVARNALRSSNQYFKAIEKENQQHVMNHGTLRDSIIRVRSDLDHSESTSARLQEENDKLKVDLAAARATESLEEQLEKAKTEIDFSTRRRLEMTKLKEMSELQLKELKGRADEAESEAERLREQLSRSEGRISDLERLLEERSLEAGAGLPSDDAVAAETLTDPPPFVPEPSVLGPLAQPIPPIPETDDPPPSLANASPANAPQTLVPDSPLTTVPEDNDQPEAR
jgi:hypothetical protein